VGKPSEGQQHSIGFSPDDAKADENDGDGVECGAEEEKGLIVVKGPQHFAGSDWCVEREHCPMVNDG